MNSKDNFIGTRLALFRKSIGLRQAEFAKLLGKGQSAISQIECGKNSLDIDLLRVLAEKLDLNPNWLILNKGEILLSKSEENEASGYKKIFIKENELLKKYVASLEELIRNKDVLIEKIKNNQEFRTTEQLIQ